MIASRSAGYPHWVQRRTPIGGRAPERRDSDIASAAIAPVQTIPMMSPTELPRRAKGRKGIESTANAADKQTAPGVTPNCSSVTQTRLFP